MTNQLISNKVTGIYLVTFGLVSVGFFIIGNLLVFAEHGFSWTAPVLAGILAVAVFIAAPWRIELLWRPFQVEIMDSGVIFHQRYWRKPLFVQWSDFMMLNVHPMDPDVSGLKMAKDGYLFINGRKHALTLNWAVAMAVREAYHDHMGRYPENPTMSG